MAMCTGKRKEQAVATRSEKAAKIAGATVAVLSLGVLLYKSLGPLLAGEDPWLVGTVAGGIALLLVGAAIGAARLRRRQLASRIKRR